MSLSGAAAAMGLPESLVQRSAEARSAETGQSVDDILAAWAGGEAADAPLPPEPAEEPAGSKEVVEENPESAPPDPEPVVDVPITHQPETPAKSPTRAPVPAEVTAAEAAHLPEVVTVPTAGITERTNFVIPKWLTALLLVAPFVALFALGGSATGTCGEATELTTNVITGQIVNCDGTEFTGGGAGGGGTDFIALGEQIYSGAAVTGVNCAGCHGASGQGSGSFPALTGVLTTFGSCTDHIDWVTQGSGGYPNGYGDTNKPTAGGMPAFGGTLTPEQVAAVAAFERSRFGGEPPEEALVDCGLVEPEGGEDGAAVDGEGGEGSEEGGSEEGGTSTTAPADGEEPEAAAGSSG